MPPATGGPEVSKLSKNNPYPVDSVVKPVALGLRHGAVGLEDKTRGLQAAAFVFPECAGQRAELRTIGAVRQWKRQRVFRSGFARLRFGVH